MYFRKQAHVTYLCDYHIVISTKYRHQWINEGIFAYLELKCAEIRKYYPAIIFKTVNHDKDHIHALISIPPKMSVSAVVRIITCNTSRELKQKFPFLKQVYWGTDAIWSEGYFVSTVGINEQMIQQYIISQGKKDSGQIRLGFD